MSTDISTPRARCLRDCRQTPYEYGCRGYVRRCEHGRLWQWDYLDDYVGCWAPVWRIQLITRWRAARALREANHNA